MLQHRFECVKNTAIELDMNNKNKKFCLNFSDLDQQNLNFLCQ